MFVFTVMYTFLPSIKIIVLIFSFSSTDHTGQDNRTGTNMMFQCSLEQGSE